MIRDEVRGPAVVRGARRASGLLTAVLGALLVAFLAAGTASAQVTVPSDPAPYGGLLEAPEPGEATDGAELLEISLLGLGTVNGLAFAVAAVGSRLRGSSATQTRRALIARTGAGVVHESRRQRRERAARAARPH